MAAIKTSLRDTTQRMVKRMDTLKFRYSHNYVFWIVNRYLYYFRLAIIHGYKMVVWKTCKIFLTYTETRHLSILEKKKFMFSSQMFDNMFYIHFEGRNFDNEKFCYYPDRKFKKDIEEKLSTDAVYQFIKK